MPGQGDGTAPLRDPGPNRRGMRGQVNLGTRRGGHDLVRLGGSDHEHDQAAATARRLRRSRRRGCCFDARAGMAPAVCRRVSWEDPWPPWTAAPDVLLGRSLCRGDGRLALEITYDGAGETTVESSRGCARITATDGYRNASASAFVTLRSSARADSRSVRRLGRSACRRRSPLDSWRLDVSLPLVLRLAVFQLTTGLGSRGACPPPV
jgi:hypothetical protein